MTEIRNGLICILFIRITSYNVCYTKLLRCGTIILKNHVELHLEEGANLIGSRNPFHYISIDPFIDATGQARGKCFRITSYNVCYTKLLRLILHLIQGEMPLRSVVVARDATVVLQPVSHAGIVFNELFRLFVGGMNEPIPFFIETSYRYALYACQGNLARAEREAVV